MPHEDVVYHWLDTVLRHPGPFETWTASALFLGLGNAVAFDAILGLSIAAAEHLRRSYLADDKKYLEEHAKEKGPYTSATWYQERTALCTGPSLHCPKRTKSWLGAPPEEVGEAHAHEGTNS